MSHGETPKNGGNKDYEYKRTNGGVDSMIVLKPGTKEMPPAKYVLVKVDELISAVHILHKDYNTIVDSRVPQTKREIPIMEMEDIINRTSSAIKNVLGVLLTKELKDEDSIVRFGDKQSQRKFRDSTVRCSETLSREGEGISGGSISNMEIFEKQRHDDLQRYIAGASEVRYSRGPQRGQVRYSLPDDETSEGESYCPFPEDRGPSEDCETETEDEL